MRKIATVPSPTDTIRRVMTYSTDGGAYLFLYTSLEDGPCEFDEWYDSLTLAEQEASARFGLRPDDWTVIDDPPAGAQHDWIRPTRVKRDATGKKLWGQFEANPTAG
jgi:hypothetical protein